MDFGTLFTTAVRHLRHNPWLWVLGLIYVLPSFLALQALPSTSGFQPEMVFRQWSDPAALAELDAVILPLLEAVSDFGRVTRFVVGFTAVLLVIWFVTTLAEAGLILIIGRAQTGQTPLSPLALLREMRRLLLRLIAIDTLLFFPLFIVLLTAELIVLGGLAYILFSGTLNLQAIAGPLALSLLCTVSLLCLAIPMGLLTLLFRLVAFRVAAIEDRPTKSSISHTWQLLKQQWFNFLLVGLMLIIIQLLAEGVLRLLHTPFPAWLGALLTLPLTAVLHAFYSAVWTIAYTQLAMSKEQ